MATQVVPRAPSNGKAQRSTSPGTLHTSLFSTLASSKCATSKLGGCVRLFPETICDASGMGAEGQHHRSRQVPAGRGRKRHHRKRVSMASCAQTTRVARARRAPGAASCNTSLSSFPPFRSSSPKNSCRPHNSRRLCTRHSTAHHELLFIHKSETNPLTNNDM